MSKRPARILLSGFEPFAGMTHNPSAALAQRWQDRIVEGCVVESLVLPTCFAHASRQLHKRFREITAHSWVPLIVCTGLASERRALSFEYKAVNIQTTSVPDNKGFTPTHKHILASSPNSRPATLPVTAMAQAVKTTGYPVEISQSAGDYVCNEVFYRLMQMLSVKKYRSTLGGFIHLPQVTAKEEKALDRALEAALTVALRLARLNTSAN